MQEFDNNKVPVKKLWQVIVASSVGTVIEWLIPLTNETSAC